MKISGENKIAQLADLKEDFNWGTAIAVFVLLMMFFSAIIYVLISSYMG